MSAPMYVVMTAVFDKFDDTPTSVEPFAICESSSEASRVAKEMNAWMRRSGLHTDAFTPGQGDDLVESPIDKIIVRIGRHGSYMFVRPLAVPVVHMPLKEGAK